MNIFNRFVQDESGATAIEYCLIAALMAVALIAAVPLLSTGINTSFTNIAAQLTTVTP
ncbi:MAG TPA: Flp family type IVb pilin [Reyranella sp.]|jgi:pilus assembly protein Flp/PilA|nr:Flp family type IVb pilin [Reyranella sp.]